MKHESTTPEERLERAYQRLGTRDPMCTTCEESDPRCLELHHIAGRKHHDDTVIQCRNCHRKLSDTQLGHPSPSASGPDAQLIIIGRFLLGLADWFALLVERLRDFGCWLIELAAEYEEAPA